MFLINKLLPLGLSLMTQQANMVMTSTIKRSLDDKRLGQDEKNLTGLSFENLKSSFSPTIYSSS